MSASDGTGAPVVLVVDDDPLVCLLAREALEVAGFSVVEAGTGTAALAQIERAAPALVLLDIGLPDMDGFDVLRRLRSQYDAMQVPVVMITGLQDLDVIHDAHRDGANDFLVKPIHWATLGYRAHYVIRAADTARQMRDLERRHSAILKALPDTLFVLDRDGRFLDHHDASGQPLHVEPGGRRGRSVAELLPARLGRKATEVIRRTLDSGELQTAVFALRGRRGERHYETRMVPHGPGEVLAVVREVTAEKQSEARIRRLAYYDPLTGMPNRQHFLELLDTELTSARERQDELALLFFDLDGFKRINDTLGHAMGDALLRAVSERLHGALREGDTVTRLPALQRSGVHVARLGGDEFTVIVPRLSDAGAARAIAQRILSVLAPPFAIGEQQLAITASIGIALYPEHGSDAATLLKHADTAMYHAKAQGRNNSQLYSAALTNRAMGRLDVERSLRDGLGRGEFALCFQPQVAVPGGTVVGMEALVRWKHPARGTVLPADFLSVAEETGLIVPLGEWVVREACRHVGGWHQSGLGPIRVAVNVSTAHLRTADFADRILAILAETHTPPSFLELEITESTLLEPDPGIVDRLHRLRAAGVHFVLDDFGSGYSSLGYVKRLPIERLKIDKSLVAGLPRRVDDCAIVRAVISVARSLGLDVMAEGVENAEQVEFLVEAGCGRFQGYHFGEPVSAIEAAALLARGRQEGALTLPEQS